MAVEILVVKAPCCYRRRECWARAVYVVDVNSKRIVLKIPSYRCDRGEGAVYHIPVSQNIVVAEHYASKSGRQYTKVVFKPVYMSEQDAKSLVTEVLGDGA
jgi:hypothetical protein